MPRFQITLKIRTLEPPHESLGSTHEVVSLSILDPYRKIHDVIKTLDTAKDLPDDKPKTKVKPPHDNDI